MVLCLEIRKMSLTIWKDVQSLTIFSNSMFIFLIGKLQILGSALQEQTDKVLLLFTPNTYVGYVGFEKSTF